VNQIFIFIGQQQPQNLDLKKIILKQWKLSFLNSTVKMGNFVAIFVLMKLANFFSVGNSKKIVLDGG
jgi:hypothetical protein